MSKDLPPHSPVRYIVQYHVLTRWMIVDLERSSIWNGIRRVEKYAKKTVNRHEELRIVELLIGRTG